MKLICFRKHKPGAWLGWVNSRAWGESWGEFGNIGWGQMKCRFVNHGKTSIFYSKGNFFFSMQSSSVLLCLSSNYLRKSLEV